VAEDEKTIVLTPALPPHGGEQFERAADVVVVVLERLLD
jgi:hypothetical protein